MTTQQERTCSLMGKCCFAKPHAKNIPFSPAQCQCVRSTLLKPLPKCLKRTFHNVFSEPDSMSIKHTCQLLFDVFAVCYLLSMPHNNMLEGVIVLEEFCKVSSFSEMPPSCWCVEPLSCVDVCACNVFSHRNSFSKCLVYFFSSEL